MLNFHINISEKGLIPFVWIQPAPFSHLMHPQKLHFAFFWQVKNKEKVAWVQLAENGSFGV